MDKAIRIDQRTHTQFKAACALHGVQMQEAATQALRAVLLWWERGYSGSFVTFVDLKAQPDDEAEAER
jgi:hypothetical protein